MWSGAYLSLTSVNSSIAGGKEAGVWSGRPGAHRHRWTLLIKCGSELAERQFANAVWHRSAIRPWIPFHSICAACRSAAPRTHSLTFRSRSELFILKNCRNRPLLSPRQTSVLCEPQFYYVCFILLAGTNNCLISRLFIIYKSCLLKDHRPHSFSLITIFFLYFLFFRLYRYGC